MKTVRAYKPMQTLLLPPSIEQWLPEGHLARFVREVASTMDLTAIELTYKEERGNPPFHPQLMVTLLLHAYSTGTYSSRRTAAKLVDDVAHRFRAVGNSPDFRTLRDFRKMRGDAMNGLFGQVHKLCAEASPVTLRRRAVDGTKLKANASKHKAMGYASMSEREAALKAQVAELLARAQATDDAEDAKAHIAEREQKGKGERPMLRLQTSAVTGPGAGEADTQGAAQLHQIRVAHPDDVEWLHPGLYGSAGSGRCGAGDRGATRDAERATEPSPGCRPRWC